MAAADQLKKPTSAYWLWMGDNREKIQGILGTKAVPAVGKKAGEMWASLSAAAKAPYEKKAKEQKDAYEKYIQTDAGKKALEDMKAAKTEAKAEKSKKADEQAEKLAAKEERKNERQCKAELKALTKEKDENLKKPQTAYWMWLGDNRSKIAEAIGGGNVAAVAKKGGEMWKALSAQAKAPYEKKAKEQKDAYDAYISSAEGAAALKALKEKTKAVKDQMKRKSADADDGEGEEEGEEDEEEAEAPPKKAARKAAKLGA